MPTPKGTRPAAPGAGFPDPADRQLLDQARREIDRERARVAFDAVDELAAMAEAFTAAYVRGEDTGAAMAEVVRAMSDAMGAARRAGLVGGAS